jgi:hypothetical protein
MQLQCKQCRARIPAADVNLDKLVARCRACDAVFAFEHELRREPAAELGAMVPDGPFRSRLDVPRVRRRGPVPRPERFRIATTGGLDVSWHWFSPKYLFLALFCVAWDSFLVFWYGTVLFTGGPWIAVVFPVVHVAVGVGLTYSVLAHFLNRTRVSVDGDVLRVRHAPLPWAGARAIPVHDVAQIYCEHRQPSTSRSGRTFAVSAVLRSGDKVTLLKGLEDANDALYLEQAIEDFLRIDDAPVGGELPM